MVLAVSESDSKRKYRTKWQVLKEDIMVGDLTKNARKKN
jgi:hypothetical protein